MSPTPLLLAHPGMHGVAIYARDVAAAVAAIRPERTAVDPAALAAVDAGSAVHVHFTDRLWGDSPEEAATAFVALAERHPVSVTLHDLPQPSDGARNLPRRRAAYAAVAASARGVVVNSAHELALLREEDVWSGPATSIPLPVTVRDDVQRRAPDGSVGVLGYFYPGKGHDEVAQAAAAAGLTKMTVLGRASDGHAADLDAFVRRAAALGVRVEVTGWLEDDEIARRGSSVSVPVIAHRHVSASGSLASWIAWGRRPVAVRNRYIDEMAALRPGTVCGVAETDLVRAISDALGRPDTTWHGQSTPPMSLAEVAEAYVDWWSGLRR